MDNKDKDTVAGRLKSKSVKIPIPKGSLTDAILGYSAKEGPPVWCNAMHADVVGAMRNFGGSVFVPSQLGGC